MPTLFSSGVVVPVLKDKLGDSTGINNYIAITLSLSVSKLFEKCILLKFGHLLAVSPLQFGFRKSYPLRAVVAKIVSGLSIFSVALLNLSKAFDRVQHDTLFIKFMKLNIPPCYNC